MSERNIRSEENQTTYYFVGPLNLDRKAKRATTVMNSELLLGSDEFDALDILAMHEGEPISFETLYDTVWDAAGSSCERDTARQRLNHLMKQVKEAGGGFMWIEHYPESGYTFKTRWGHNWQKQNIKTEALTAEDSLIERMHDESTNAKVQFTMRCEECDKILHSSSASVIKSSPTAYAEPRTVPYEIVSRQEKDDFKRAALREATGRFNLCHACGRIVCDSCFLLCSESCLCRSCADRLGVTGESIHELDSDLRPCGSGIDKPSVNIAKTAERSGNAPHTKSRKSFVKITAACIALFVVGAGVFLATDGNSGFTDIGGVQVPMAELPCKEGICIMPDFDRLTIPAGERNVTIPFHTREDNNCYMTFEILLSENGEALFASGMVKADTGGRMVTFNRPLEAGEYEAVLIIKTFTPEKKDLISEETIAFGLIAGEAEVMQDDD
jgi:DNA-binding winged helix-turn-helix (wHTH) protein